MAQRIHMAIERYEKFRSKIRHHIHHPDISKACTGLILEEKLLQIRGVLLSVVGQEIHFKDDHLGCRKINSIPVDDLQQVFQELLRRTTSVLLRVRRDATLHPFPYSQERKIHELSGVIPSSGSIVFD